MKTWICWIIWPLLSLAGVTAWASGTPINLTAGSYYATDIDVSATDKILTISAAQSGSAKLALVVKSGEDFDLTADLDAQIDYMAINDTPSLSISIGSYATPALEPGTWHVLLLNLDQHQSTTVTLDTARSATSKVPTEFQIHFDAPSQELEDAFGGADELECDVAPWTDTTPVTINGASTPIGQFRRSLLQSALDELSTQVHSPVPVVIQACWKNFDDSGEHAGSYTLAAATSPFIFTDGPGLPLENTWYSMAPVSRLAGTRLCNLGAGLDCSMPDIIVWFNSADVAKGNYDGPEDEPLIRSVTMHEVTHGLGFLSHVDVRREDDDGEKNPNFMRSLSNRADVFTANIGYNLRTADDPIEYRTLPFLALGTEDRAAAATSGQFLVWADPATAASNDNVLATRTAPNNLVQLHAPGTIQPGSTMSHLSSVHQGQLMTAVIQRNYPQTLGLAEPILDRVGWNTEPLDIQSPYDQVTPGNWFDPARNGHGIELEPTVHEAAGDIYTIVFYTYDANGKPEYYLAPGRLKDGHMGSFDDPAKPTAILRPIFDPAKGEAVYPDGRVGSLSIDFTPDARTHAACDGREETALATLSWSIDGDSDTWCITPALGLTEHPPASTDLNGFWNAGDADSGWGFAVIETHDNMTASLNNALLYYYDDHNQPRWVQVDPGKTTGNVYEMHGYCRTCPTRAMDGTVIGNMSLHLVSPEHVEQPSGDNSVSIAIDKHGFHRSGTAVRSYSLPAAMQ